VEAALAQLRAGYQADGYDLLVDDLTDGVATVRIAAGADACEECLVAKPIAEAILRASLRGLPEIKSVELIYPKDQ